jgi:hypothetical protein
MEDDDNPSEEMTVPGRPAPIDLSDSAAALLRDKIADAAKLLRIAEQDLEHAVATLKPVLIGDKRMATESLESSFERLRAARRLVTDLEALLAARVPTSSR